MITLKEPVKLNSCRPFVSVSEGFPQRIIGNYDLMRGQFSPEDLLFHLTAPPNLPEETASMTSLVMQNQLIDNSNLNVGIISNVVNRILMSSDHNFTYQDQVYISTILQQMGVVDVQQFITEVRHLHQEQEHIHELLQLYRQSAPALRATQKKGSTDDTKAKSAADGSGEDAPLRESRYFLQNDIYNRLQTQSIYATMNAYSQNAVTNNQQLRHQSIQLAEFTRLGNLLTLHQLRQETLINQPVQLRQRVNRYEVGDILPPPANEGEVLSQAAQAALFSTVTHVMVQQFSKTYSGGENWQNLTHVLRQSVESSLNRFEEYHSQETIKNQSNQYYDQLLDGLYQEERSLLTQFHHTSTTLEQHTQQLVPSPSEPPTQLTLRHPASQEVDETEGEGETREQQSQFTQQLNQITQQILTGQTKTSSKSPDTSLRSIINRETTRLVERQNKQTALVERQQKTFTALQELTTVERDLLLMEEAQIPISQADLPPQMLLPPASPVTLLQETGAPITHTTLQMTETTVNQGVYPQNQETQLHLTQVTPVTLQHLETAQAGAEEETGFPAPTFAPSPPDVPDQVPTVPGQEVSTIQLSQRIDQLHQQISVEQKNQSFANLIHLDDSDTEEPSDRPVSQPTPGQAEPLPTTEAPASAPLPSATQLISETVNQLSQSVDLHLHTTPPATLSHPSPATAQEEPAVSQPGIPPVSEDKKPVSPPASAPAPGTTVTSLTEAVSQLVEQVHLTQQSPSPLPLAHPAPAPGQEAPVATEGRQPTSPSSTPPSSTPSKPASQPPVTPATASQAVERILQKERERIVQVMQNATYHSTSETVIPGATPSSDPSQPPVEQVFLQNAPSPEEQERQLIQQMTKIDQHNREMHQRVTEIKSQPPAPAKAKPTLDRARTMADALRSIDDPTTVLKELAAQPAPMVKRQFSPEVEALLSQADPVTREILTKTMLYEKNPGKMAQDTSFSPGNLAGLNSESMRLERQALELIQRTETEHQVVEEVQTRNEQVLQHLWETPSVRATSAPITPPSALHFVHKQDVEYLSEELLEHLEQRQNQVHRSEETTSVDTSKTTQQTQVQQLLQETAVQSTEDITALINRTLSKQMSTITDKVYHQMEKRLQTERSRRGRF